MANKVDLNKVSYLLVTGASRGIGQTMAIECSKKLKAGSLVVLLARSASGLESTKIEILKQNSHITVITCSVDLSSPKPEELDDIIKRSLSNFDVNSFELALIIHNVGTIGNVACKAIDLNYKHEWHDYFSTNVFTVAILNTSFFRALKDVGKKVLVNVTSKAAHVPFNSMALYCAGKAAREMYFKVLAAEEPNITVLNYSPGPVETDMTVIIQGKSCDANTQEYFKNLRDTSTILTTLMTTTRFLSILQNGLFESGDHVDYYD